MSRAQTLKTQETRDNIALGNIEAYLDAVTSGTLVCPSCKKTTKYKEPTPAAAALIRARYDKLRPTLSTVEQTITDTRDKMSEETILAELQGLFIAKPYLLDKLIQLRDAAKLIQEGEEAITLAASSPETV